jgi:hypothetical protein
VLPARRPIRKLAGREVALPYGSDPATCPVRACRDWIAAALDPGRYAGHSLRAGFCTQAYMNDAREFDIMRQTGHLLTVRQGSLQ